MNEEDGDRGDDQRPEAEPQAATGARPEAGVSGAGEGSGTPHSDRDGDTAASAEVAGAGSEAPLADHTPTEPTGTAGAEAGAEMPLDDGLHNHAAAAPAGVAGAGSEAPHGEDDHTPAEPTGAAGAAGVETGAEAPPTLGSAAVRDARRWLSRRSVLIAGASGVAVAGLAAGTATGKLPFSQALQRALGVASSNPTTQLGSTRVERVYSAARGRMVDLVFLLPSKTPPRGLPMSLMLHGLHGNARSAAPTGTLKQLSSDVARKAVPAYGFVAVDGGDNYWHQVHPNDDPMAMLLEEVPQWLRARGFAGDTGQPFACTGVSMGGFGALLYTRRRVERRQPPAAVATLAPALITTWPEMEKRHIFTGMEDWVSLDPLRHIAETASVPNAIWCGTEDSFITGVRRYIDVAHPAVAHTAHGKHGDTFNKTVVPSLVSFLGKHVPRTTA